MCARKLAFGPVVGVSLRSVLNFHRDHKENVGVMYWVSMYIDPWGVGECGGGRLAPIACLEYSSDINYMLLLGLISLFHIDFSPYFKQLTAHRIIVLESSFLEGYIGSKIKSRDINTQHM